MSLLPFFRKRPAETPPPAPVKLTPQIVLERLLAQEARRYRSYVRRFRRPLLPFPADIARMRAREGNPCGRNTSR